MIIDNDRIKKFKIRFLLAITVIVIIGFIMVMSHRVCKNA
jgi:heme/copper-type cytochrome/quinol oxidase subunit 4